MDLQTIAEMKPIVEPVKFLRVLKCLSQRVQEESKFSISLKELEHWGISKDESLSYLVMMTEMGILKQNVQCYSSVEDCYVDLPPSEVNQHRPSQIKFWFRPNIAKEDLAAFFH